MPMLKTFKLVHSCYCVQPRLSPSIKFLAEGVMFPYLHAINRSVSNALLRYHHGEAFYGLQLKASLFLNTSSESHPPIPQNQDPVFLLTYDR
jgi:hypothetical protein